VTIGLVFLPLAIILRSILPDLLSISILHAIKQLAGINSSIAESKRAISLPLVTVDHILRNTIAHNGPPLVNIIDLEHHALPVVYFIHYLIGLVVKIGTYPSSRNVLLSVLIIL